MYNSNVTTNDITGYLKESILQVTLEIKTCILHSNITRLCRFLIKHQVPWDYKDIQNQVMGSWCIQDWEKPPVLTLLELCYSIKGKLLKVTTINLEVELTTFVYLMSLSFSLTLQESLDIDPIFLDQNTNLMM